MTSSYNFACFEGSFKNSNISMYSLNFSKEILNPSPRIFSSTIAWLMALYAQTSFTIFFCSSFGKNIFGKFLRAVVIIVREFRNSNSPYLHLNDARYQTAPFLITVSFLFGANAHRKGCTSYPRLWKQIIGVPISPMRVSFCLIPHFFIQSFRYHKVGKGKWSSTNPSNFFQFSSLTFLGLFSSFNNVSATRHMYIIINSVIPLCTTSAPGFIFHEQYFCIFQQ